MDAALKLTSIDLDAEDLQDLSRDLANTLNRETELEATLPEESGEPGTRGDAITLGQIILTALSAAPWLPCSGYSSPTSRESLPWKWSSSAQTAKSSRWRQST